MSTSTPPSPPDPASFIRTMMNKATLAGIPESEVLRSIAELVDSAEDIGNRPALDHAIVLMKSNRSGCSAVGSAELDYFEANAWSAVRRLTEHAEQDPWTWDRPEFEQEVVCLRRALSSNGFQALPMGRRLQILTNLGNLMNRLGRPVEAISHYDRALNLDPHFGMALGNRGLAFSTYARYHYDNGHKKVFLAKARDDLASALKNDIEDHASEAFTAHLADLDKLKFNLGLRMFAMDGFEIGATRNDVRFRTWALEHRLFLNPLNDVGAFQIAARDVLQLPTIIASIEVGSSFHGFFNQLKQEYVAARWFAFEALAPSRASVAAERIADRETNLLDARDGAIFGLRLEKLKVTFRSTYSLLDKIAVFLNTFFDLGLPSRRANIRSVWYKRADQKSAVLNARLPKNNLPLRGLFWLSKDFVETDEAYLSSMEPDAQFIATVRNRLEHQYLRVTPIEKQPWKKDVGYNIPKELLRLRTIRLLHSARAALIYLVLAIHSHENANKDKYASKLVVSDRLDPIPPDALGGTP